MVVDESTPSNRMPPRRQTNAPDRQTLQYRQTLPSEKTRDIAWADLFFHVLEYAGNSPENPTLDYVPRRVEVLEADPLGTILTAIDKLMAPDEDSGDPAATEHAYRNTRAIVESAYGLLLTKNAALTVAGIIPVVTTDDRGGVRISWQHGDRHVRTNFAAAEGLRSYLYFESPAEHDVQAVQPYTLSDRLLWLLNA
jgi:hypothetical protein